VKSDLVDIEMQLHHQTWDAILASDDGERENAVWIPKSQVEYVFKDEAKKIIIVTMPSRLAIDKGLV